MTQLDCGVTHTLVISSTMEMSSEIDLVRVDIRTRVQDCLVHVSTSNKVETSAENIKW